MRDKELIEKLDEHMLQTIKEVKGKKKIKVLFTANVGEFPTRTMLKAGETRTIKELIADDILHAGQRYFVNGEETRENRIVRNGDVVVGIPHF